MGSAQRIKRTSRRMRKIAAIKEKNRARYLTLVAPSPSASLRTGSVEEIPSPVPTDAVNNVEPGPESGEMLRLPAVTSRSPLPELDDDAPILPAIRDTDSDSDASRDEAEVLPEVQEKRDALLTALREFLHDAHGHSDAFYDAAFEFEGRLLVAIRTAPDRALSSVGDPVRQRERAGALDRQAAWEQEFLAELEDILLNAVNHSIAIGQDARNAGHPLFRFAESLWMSRFAAKSGDVLQRFLLGASAMRGVHARLAGRTPSQPDVPRFMLYNVRHSGSERIVDGPSAAGIAVWTRMRQRLLRGQSCLARRLQKRFGS